MDSSEEGRRRIFGRALARQFESDVTPTRTRIIQDNGEPEVRWSRMIEYTKLRPEVENLMMLIGM